MRKKLCVPCSQKGLTLVELLVALMITGLMLAALDGIVGQVEQTQAFTRERSALAEDAHFAMERMVRAVQHTRLLMLPYPDNPGTNWREHVREQTIPQGPPEGSSSFATAVLAVTLPADQDLDGDGVPDADNDDDGSFDEDPYGDLTRDTASGIYQIDDDGDGQFDEMFAGQYWDDDEDGGAADEDPVNDVDDDGDGKVGEDPFMDNNGDGAPGVAGVDDDGDGSIDEGFYYDDDEDGQNDEDSLEPLVFYLNGNELIERTPVPWDENGGGAVTGRDFIRSTIAENVTLFRVERVPDAGTRAQLVDLTLELTNAAGETISVNTRARVGSAL